MNRSDISELHFIVSIDNVPSIMTHGILSHNRSQILNHRDISEEGVQNRRSDKRSLGQIINCMIMQIFILMHIIRC